VVLRFGHLSGVGLHEVGRLDLYPSLAMLRLEDEETLTEWDDILVRLLKCLLYRVAAGGSEPVIV